MKLEILDFYPKEKTDDGFVGGDIKIRLPDLKINVLGIYICRRTNGKWLILMPCRNGVADGGGKVKFPVVAFDEADHKALMSELYAQVPGFIEKRIADTENPIVFPAAKPSQPTIQQPSHQKGPPGAQTSQAKAKPAIASKSATAAIPAKQRAYNDLAPRPDLRKNTRNPFSKCKS
jgi:hypothetical protein